MPSHRAPPGRRRAPPRSRSFRTGCAPPSPTAPGSSRPASRPTTSARASWLFANSTRPAPPPAARAGFPTACTAPPATWTIASRPLPCSASTTRWAPAPPAAASGASSASITTWSCRTVPGRSPSASSGPGRPAPAPKARPTSCAPAGNSTSRPMSPSSACPGNGRTSSSKVSRATARTRPTIGPGAGMESKVTSAGWNPRPTRCTCACCSPDTGPIRPARIARANAFNPRRCSTGLARRPARRTGALRPPPR